MKIKNQIVAIVLTFIMMIANVICFPLNIYAEDFDIPENIEIACLSDRYVNFSLQPSEIIFYIRKDGEVKAKAELNYLKPFPDTSRINWIKTDEPIPNTGFIQTISYDEYDLVLYTDTQFLRLVETHIEDGNVSKSDYAKAYVEISAEPTSASVSLYMNNMTTRLDFGETTASLYYSNDNGSTWNPYWKEGEIVKNITIPSNSSIKVEWYTLPPIDMDGQDVEYKVELGDLPEGVQVTSVAGEGTNQVVYQLVYWAGEPDDSDVDIKQSIFDVHISVDGGEWLEPNEVIIPPDTDYTYKISYRNDFEDGALLEILDPNITFYVESGEWKGKYLGASFIQSGQTKNFASESPLIFTTSILTPGDTWNGIFGSGSYDYIINMHSPSADEIDMSSQSLITYSYLRGGAIDISAGGKWKQPITILPVSVSLAYSPEIEIEVEKKIVGDVPENQNDTFHFQIIGEDGSPMPQNDTVQITGEGTVKFQPIYFDKVGTYNYIIKEMKDDALPYQYDTSEKRITVNVTRNDAGIVTATYTVDGEEGPATFTNTYEKPEEPDEPDEPEKPNKPEDPKEPDIPDTSDQSHIVTYGGLFAIASLLIILLARYRKKYVI